MKRKLKSVQPQPRQQVTETLTVNHDAVNEQVILAAELVDVETREKLVRKLPPDFFLVEEHRAAQAGIRELTYRKLDYDAATLQRICGDKVNIRYLEQLVEMRPSVPENLQFHVDAMIWDKARANAVTGSIASLLEAIRNPREAPERVRSLARAVGQAFDDHAGKTFLVDPKEVVREAMRDIRERVAGRSFYPFGIEGLDFYDEPDEFDVKRRRMIPGAAPGLITVLTGTPGSGKTTAAAHIALGLGKQRRRVLYGAFEVKASMSLELMACIELGWNRAALSEGEDHIRREKLLEPDLVLLEEKMHEISEYVRFMRNPFRRNRGEKATNDRNLDILQEHISDCGCEVFIGDLWKRALRQTAPDDEEEALMRQQAMAEEMGVHCLLLQQQRLKDIEQRTDKRPTREGIKGSGAWVEIADNIFGLHRPALWKKVPDTTIEWFVLKQRFGKWPLGIEMDWNPETGHIGGGRSIEYDQPGQNANEMDFVTPRSSGSKRKRS